MFFWGDDMLNGEKMAAEIVAQLQAAGFKPTDDKTAGDAMWQAIGRGIVKHIQEAAEVDGGKVK